VWTVNPPGFGESTGPAELDCYADCALTAFGALLHHAGGAPIWLCGKSIGTTAALLAAAQGGAAGLILRNVMPLRELLCRHYAWRTAGLSRLLSAAVPTSLDCLANAARCAAPAIFVVSRDDRVSPATYQRAVIDAYGGATTVLEVSGGHDDRQLAPADETAYRTALRRALPAA
jgi:pimeloyl-ACP methyl ester carboxylesterase